MSLFNHEEKDPLEKVAEKVAEKVGKSKIESKLKLKTAEDVKNVTGPTYEISVRIPRYEFIFRIRTK